MRAPWHLTLKNGPLFLRDRDRKFVDRLNDVAREIDDRAAARLDRLGELADPEGHITFLRVGTRPAARR